MRIPSDLARTGLDVSARTGVLLGAWNAGLSYQPNLLSRGTRDQAMITGVAAATALGWGTTSHSFWRSFADRLPMAGDSQTGYVAAGALVDATVAAAALGIVRAVPWQEHESSKRALLRLAAGTTGAAAVAGLGADALELTRGRIWGRGLSLVVALGAGGAAYLSTRPGTSVAGSQAHGETAAHEDVTREVAKPVALASGVGVTVLLMAVAKGESMLSGAMSRGAARVLGGVPDDHRAAGRLASYGILAGVGWGALTAVNHILGKAGEAADEAHAVAPTAPEISGSPDSVVPWADQSRESRRWLTMTLRPEVITSVMGEPARQPIRVYAPLESAETTEDRAALLLAEIDRTRALERSVFAIFSPTGSGYVNYVATETLEFLTRGDCASACVQYSVLPSALSLTKVGLATAQTRIVVNGVMERLLAMPAADRPAFYLFGESLGSQVSEEMFEGQGQTGPTGIGLDAALWIGTPAATLWRRQLWGTRTVTQAPEIGPGSIYLPRAVRDWRDLPAQSKERVRFLLLQNADDPIPKFGAELLWRRPDWLGPQDTRPPGSPSGSRWVPVTTFFTTFIDMQNALVPTPGDFQEGGHDYRREIPEAMRTVFRLSATDDQMARVQVALRRRELGWEVKRDWEAAESLPTTKRAEAEEKVRARISAWIGHEVDTDEVAGLIAAGTEAL